VGDEKDSHIVPESLVSIRVVLLVRRWEMDLLESRNCILFCLSIRSGRED
jgi:hypothetical protein